MFPPDSSLANTATGPDLGVPWTVGVKLDQALPDPIVCHLKPGRGRRMRDLFLTHVTLFSDRLLSALREVPVDNLDVYNAAIHGPDGEIFRNYKAVNIVGKVACANLQQSEYVGPPEPPFVEFTRLVVDERAALGLDLFRLAENPMYILASERVKRRLDALGLVGGILVPIESAA